MMWPFVGRRGEWHTLRAVAWHDAARGHAQFVLITGEAGIDKTRLAEELRSWVTNQGLITASAAPMQPKAAGLDAPLIEWLRAPDAQGGIWRSWMPPRWPNWPACCRNCRARCPSLLRPLSCLS